MVAVSDSERFPPRVKQGGNAGRGRRITPGPASSPLLTVVRQTGQTGASELTVTDLFAVRWVPSASVTVTYTVKFDPLDV